MTVFRNSYSDLRPVIELGREINKSMKMMLTHNAEVLNV